MKDKLIELFFEKWLLSLEAAPYPAMFWDVPKFIQQAYVQKWLRDVYGIFVEISFIVADETHCTIVYENSPDNVWFDYEVKYSDTYEEALEAGLEYAVNLI